MDSEPLLSALHIHAAMENGRGWSRQNKLTNVQHKKLISVHGFEAHSSVFRMTTTVRPDGSVAPW
jgi:hypothetical protein